MITAIMVDQREPDWVKALKFGGAPRMITLLEAGDFLVTTDSGALLSIERKTPADFLASIADGRIFNQVHGMKQLTPWTYILITGPFTPDARGMIALEGNPTGWNWGSVQGALLQCQEMGAFVVYAAGDEDLESAVLRLGEHERGPIKVRQEREQLTISVAEQILTALPGIGEQKAAALLKYAGTAGWALCYLTDPEFEKEVQGIGKITKQHIREALQLAEGEVISVIGKDGQSVVQTARKAA
jgi:ERCC4-type nuclease